MLTSYMKLQYSDQNQNININILSSLTYEFVGCLTNILCLVEYPSLGSFAAFCYCVFLVFDISSLVFFSPVIVTQKWHSVLLGVSGVTGSWFTHSLVLLILIIQLRWWLPVFSILLLFFLLYLISCEETLWNYVILFHTILLPTNFSIYWRYLH